MAASRTLRVYHASMTDANRSRNSLDEQHRAEDTSDHLSVGQELWSEPPIVCFCKLTYLQSACAETDAPYQNRAEWESFDRSWNPERCPVLRR